MDAAASWGAALTGAGRNKKFLSGWVGRDGDGDEKAARPQPCDQGGSGPCNDHVPRGSSVPVVGGWSHSDVGSSLLLPFKVPSALLAVGHSLSPLFPFAQRNPGVKLGGISTRTRGRAGALSGGLETVWAGARTPPFPKITSR